MAWFTRSSSALIYTVFQFVAWAFAFVAVPTAMFQIPGKRNECYTMWGYKEVCGDTNYWTTGLAAFDNCPKRYTTMKAAAAFAIMSVIFTFIAMVFAILMNTRVHLPDIVPFVFSCCTVVTELVAWACVASVHNSKMCGDRWGDKFSYTAGFALMVAAWGLQIFGLFFLCHAMFWVKPEEPEDKEEFVEQ